MTSDEQEARSLRYGHKPFYILPLSSGNIAVISSDRSRCEIATNWDEVLALGATINPEPRPQPQPPVQVALNLEELGL